MKHPKRKRFDRWTFNFNIFSYCCAGPEENVASAKFNSKTIRGELRSALLDGEVQIYDMEKGNFIILFPILVNTE